MTFLAVAMRMGMAAACRCPSACSSDKSSSKVAARSSEALAARRRLERTAPWLLALRVVKPRCWHAPSAGSSGRRLI